MQAVSQPAASRVHCFTSTRSSKRCRVYASASPDGPSTSGRPADAAAVTPAAASSGRPRPRPVPPRPMVGPDGRPMMLGPDGQPIEVRASLLWGAQILNCALVSKPRSSTWAARAVNGWSIELIGITINMLTGIAAHSLHQRLPIAVSAGDVSTETPPPVEPCSLPAAYRGGTLLLPVACCCRWLQWRIGLKHLLALHQ